MISFSSYFSGTYWSNKSETEFLVRGHYTTLPMEDPVIENQQHDLIHAHCQIREVCDGFLPAPRKKEYYLWEVQDRWRIGELSNQRLISLETPFLKWLTQLIVEDYELRSNQIAPETGFDDDL